MSGRAACTPGVGLLEFAPNVLVAIRPRSVVLAEDRSDYDRKMDGSVSLRDVYGPRSGLRSGC